MARSYRRVERAEERLREALGMLEHNDALRGVAPYRTIGASAILVKLALEDVAGVENYEDSPSYKDGAASVVTWTQAELPFDSEGAQDAA